MPIVLDTDAPQIPDGWKRAADTIALANTNSDGRDLEETSEQMESFVAESMR